MLRSVLVLSMAMLSWQTVQLLNQRYASLPLWCLSLLTPFPLDIEETHWIFFFMSRVLSRFLPRIHQQTLLALLPTLVLDRLDLGLRRPSPKRTLIRRKDQRRWKVRGLRDQEDYCLLMKKRAASDSDKFGLSLRGEVWLWWISELKGGVGMHCCDVDVDLLLGV